MIKSAAFGSTFSVLLLLAVLRYVFSGFGANDHYPGTKDSHNEDFEPVDSKRSFDTYQCKIKRFFGVVELPKYFAEVVQAETTIKPELKIEILEKSENSEKSETESEELTTNPPNTILEPTVPSTNLQITSKEVFGVLIEQPREDGQLFLGEEEKEYICCYKDPRNPTEHVGRPFLVTPHIKKFHPKYMKSKVISKADKQTLYPTPATGASSNHFREHLTHIDQTMKFFPGKKIIFYDLGLTPGEVEYLKKHNETYVYREFEYDKYPEHIRHLKNYAWKVLIWSELIPEFGSICWFDSSIWFWKSPEEGINEKIRKHDSSFMYYIKEAGHDIRSHTHPRMYSYFPSDLTKHSAQTTHMKMAGAVIIYNDDRFRDNIMKWALLCALTADCIYPSLVQKTCTPPNEHLYNQTKWHERLYLPSETQLYNKNGGKIDPNALNNETLSRQSRNIPANVMDPIKIAFSRTRFCHRFDQAMMAILVENYYDFDNKYFFLNKTHQIAKPFRSGVQTTFDNAKLGSADVSNKIREIMALGRALIPGADAEYEKMRNSTLDKKSVDEKLVEELE